MSTLLVVVLTILGLAVAFFAVVTLAVARQFWAQRQRAQFWVGIVFAMIIVMLYVGLVVALA